MGLAEYKRKRNFSKTAEPPPRPLKAAPKRAASKQQAALSFVIQKHDASHLHYDLRLELDGVLKSWAVPKGPSLDPSISRLAVEVEDHPLAYATFEGTIPQGEYGGGTVMVWDRGTWEISEGENPHEGFERGRVSFTLRGSKLKGAWILIRTRPGEKPQWILKKKDDAHARKAAEYDITGKQPKSIASKRTMEQIAGATGSVRNSNRGDKPEPPEPPTPRKPARRPPKASRAAGAKASSRAAPPASRRKKAARRGSAPDPFALEGAIAARQPASLPPQLAMLGDQPPEGTRWIHEVKFDGYRTLAFIRHGQSRLKTRDDNDWTHRFPTIADALDALDLDDAVIDGEIVALNEQGVADFQMLQNALSEKAPARLVYYVFDLPFSKGADLRNCRLEDRRALLRQIITASSPASPKNVVCFSEAFNVSGQDLLDAACRLNIEGIISKLADGPYYSKRHPSWLKSKCNKRQEFVIGGYTDPKSSRSGFGSLLLGYYKDGKLEYAGNVGTGFTHDSLHELAARLQRTTVKQAPFAVPPRFAGAHWVRPEIVAEVQFTEWTREGRLRHPSFKGERVDKKPSQVTMERPTHVGGSAARVGAEALDDAEAEPVTIRKAATPRVRAERTASAKGRSAQAPPARGGKERRDVLGVSISNPDREVYPGEGITKEHVAAYYAIIGERMLSFLRGRPISLVRCPGGAGGDCFFQKHFERGEAVGLHTVKIKESKGVREYLVVDDSRGLVWLAQNGVLEIHAWGCHDDDVELPDVLVMDLDPGEGVTWADLKAAALNVRKRLTKAGLTPFVRTSGGKGLHVVAPVKHGLSWDDLKAFTRGIAISMAADEPEKFVAVMSKSDRPGKIFVDYLRNGRGATAIANYSTRARPGANVSVPLTWSRLSAARQYPSLSIAHVSMLVKGADPWAGFDEKAASVRV